MSQALYQRSYVKGETYPGNSVRHKDVWPERFNEGMLLTWRGPRDAVRGCHSLPISLVSTDEKNSREDSQRTPRYRRSQHEGRIFLAHPRQVSCSVSSAGVEWTRYQTYEIWTGLDGNLVRI